jgi:hypothetical protein
MKGDGTRCRLERVRGCTDEGSCVEPDRRWFWPLVAVGSVLGAVSAVLVALAIEDPVQPLPNLVQGVSGACLGAIRLFYKGDPLDRSDVPLIVVAALALAVCGVAFRLAASRR